MTKKSELDVFSKLMNNDPRIRASGSVRIVKNMLYNKETVLKSWFFRRLIRGLGSTRDSSQSGYFSTLVAVLSIAPRGLSSYEEYRQMVKKELNHASSKHEQGRIYLGRILAHGALIRSQYFLNFEMEQQKEILKDLLKVGKHRMCLQYGALVFVSELIEKTDKTTFKSLLSEGITEYLGNEKSSSYDKLFLILQVDNKFGYKFSKKNLGAKNALNKETLPILMVDLMKNPLYPEQLNHPVIKAVSRKLVRDTTLSKTLWGNINNELGNEKKSSVYMEAFVFTLLKEFIEAMGDQNLDVAPLIFKSNVLKLIIDKSRNRKEVLSSSMKILLKNIQNAPDNAKTEILQQILSTPGGLTMDKSLGLKILIQLTNTLGKKGVQSITEVFKEMLNGSQESVTLTSTEKNILVNMLGKLISHPNITEDTKWRVKQLKYLVDTGLFKDKCNKHSRDLINTIQSIFFTAINSRYSSLVEYTETLQEIVKYINKKMQDGMKLEVKEPENLSQDIQNGIKKAEKIHGISLKQQHWSYPVFRLLTLYSTLFLIKEPSTAKEMLEELSEVFNRLTKGDQNLSTDEPEWSEVLIDVFLFLLSKSSSCHRQLIGCVFKNLCPHLCDKAFKHILDVLDPESNSFDSSDEENMDTGSEDESDEKKRDNEEDDETSREESDEGSDESKADNPTQSEELRMFLTKALQEAGLSDTESIDLDDMPEEEGEKLNQVLAEVFKSQIKRSKSSTCNKRLNVESHFRIRILDLIECLYLSTTKLEQVLETIPPVLKLLEYSVKTKGCSSLQSKIKSCLQTLSSKKFSNIENVSQENLSDLLTSLLNKGDCVATVYSEMMPEIIKVCKFVLKASSAFSEDYSNDNIVYSVFKDHFYKFFTSRESHLTNELFSSVMQSEWPAMYPLSVGLSQWAFDDALNVHKQIQAFKLLELFILRTRYLQDVPKEYFKTVEKLFSNLQKGIITKCKELVENKCDKVNKQVLFSFLQRLNSSKHKERLNWNDIKANLSLIPASTVLTNSNDLRAFKSLCKSLNLDCDIPKKVMENTQPVTNDGEKERRGTKRRKVNSKQLKKKSKMLRHQAMEVPEFTFSNEMLDTE